MASHMRRAFPYGSETSPHVDTPAESPGNTRFKSSHPHSLNQAARAILRNRFHREGLRESRWPIWATATDVLEGVLRGESSKPQPARQHQRTDQGESPGGKSGEGQLTGFGACV
jgi:hypothetical protein